MTDAQKSGANRPWGDAEKVAWRDRQVIQRSYQHEVVGRLEALPDQYRVRQHGALSVNPDAYPLFVISSSNWQPGLPTVLVTGGVHGYETSGVMGALAFLEGAALAYLDRINLICVPCVSPWGYETINRWNPLAIDPNRAFYADSPAEESAALMKVVASFDSTLLMHMDLHETTDTDNTIFRPDRAARDGIAQDVWNIPDGFYTVGDTANPQPGFQRAVIDAVRRVTHIAPKDSDGCLIGKPVEQEGVINYDVKALFLCTGFSGAQFCTTTEVYPDSPRTDADECARAQVAAVCGGLDFCLGPAREAP